MRQLEQLKELKKLYPSLSANQAEREIINTLETGVAPFLWGAPGVGKTTIVYSLAQKMGARLYDVKLSQRSPVSTTGL
ncbi:MAG: AAA family ATPase, partial [Candidatus Kryptonium sp.]